LLRIRVIVVFEIRDLCASQEALRPLVARCSFTLLAKSIILSGLCLGWILPKAKSSTFYSVIGPCGPEVVCVVCLRTAWWIFEFRSNTISNHLLREIASMWIVLLFTSDAQSPSHSSCHIDTKRVQSKMAVLLLYDACASHVWNYYSLCNVI